MVLLASTCARQRAHSTFPPNRSTLIVLPLDGFRWAWVAERGVPFLWKCHFWGKERRAYNSREHLKKEGLDRGIGEVWRIGENRGYHWKKSWRGRKTLHLADPRRLEPFQQRFKLVDGQTI